jgi:CBS domain-containing protein
MGAGDEALAPAVVAALRQHAPFDEMDAASLRFLVGRLRLAYYPRDAVVLAPDNGTADRLCVIKQGSVRGGAGAAELVMGAGECFPIGALIGRRATFYTYRAAEDCFLWELGADDFHSLIERSGQFHAFCTRALATMVERAHRAQRAEAAQALLDRAGMLAPLRSVVVREPISCMADEPVGQVLETLRAARIGSMVVVDRERIPVGIFTVPDVLDRVSLAGLPLSIPIAEVMTAGPVALEEDATLADAAVAMARRGIRHVVVTRDGRLTGVVSERDLFALQRTSLGRTSIRIRAADSVAELASAAQDVREVAGQLLAHGVAAEQLTAMTSALNDSLTRRLIELAAARHAMPAAWCWLALGSEGRMEQTLVTDQDNALIVRGGDPPLGFADEVNRGLEACGFPLCKGDIMARNPRWCLDARSWRAVFDGWIRHPHQAALLHASIFFDFRPLAGDGRLAGTLRDAVLAQARSTPAFLRALTEAALQSRPPLGLLRDFAADQVDLKLSGVRPFVDAARVLALAAGSAETGTAPRLREAGLTTAADAFNYLQTLRLRHGNRVSTGALGPIDRRILKEAFRQATLVQERIRLDYRL